MPRVYKQVARKDYPAFNIKKGDEYYSWAFRFGGERKSLTPSKRSQLTQSEFLQWYYDFVDGLELTNPDSIEDDVQSMISDIEEQVSELESRLENIPDQLREGPAATMIQERIDGLQSWADDLGSVDFSDLQAALDGDEDEEEQEAEEEKSEEKTEEGAETGVEETREEKIEAAMESLRDAIMGSDPGF